MRTAQREATRTQIVKAALSSMAERGYNGVSTRYIASVAQVSQGLLTYHFKSKESLWRAAADDLFAMLDETVFRQMPILEIDNNRAFQRELVRRLVFFNAEHPELLRFLIHRGPDNDARTEWLVDTHVKPAFNKFSGIMSGAQEKHLPHMFYAMAGACGVIFNVPFECEQATGVKPGSKSAIQNHAEYLAELFVP